jgi:ribosome recycling factor
MAGASAAPPPSREELEALVRDLRDEVERLKEEIRRIRRQDSEVPPHYL